MGVVFVNGKVYGTDLMGTEEGTEVRAMSEMGQALYRMWDGPTRTGKRWGGAA